MILYAKYSNHRHHGLVEFWTCDNDGSNHVKIPINLPTGYVIDYLAKLSSDGKRLIFSANKNISDAYIFSCNVDGSDLIQITSNSDELEFRYFHIVGMADCVKDA